MKIVGHKDARLYELDGYGHGMTEPAFQLLIKEVRMKCSSIQKALVNLRIPTELKIKLINIIESSEKDYTFGEIYLLAARLKGTSIDLEK